MSETDYLNQICQLVELQKVDDQIHEVSQSLENAPRDLEELRRRFESMDGARSVALDKLAHLQEQQRRISLEIDDDAARIKKSKNKMMQVGNAREYNAMVREMDNMERTNRNREEERAVLLEALERHNENVEELESAHSTLKAELEAKSDSLAATLREAEEKLATLANKRKNFSKGIPAPIFQRYEFIRRRLEHPVIVPADNGICSGCHIAIPPQTFIELQTGQQILNCPNCQRLIFWSEHFGGSEAAPKPARSKRAPKENAAAGEGDDFADGAFEEREEGFGADEENS